MEDITQQFSTNDMSENKLMAILCYLGVFVIIPATQAPHSPYIRHNANQGIMITLITMIINMFGSFLNLVPFGSLLVMVVNFAIQIVPLTAIFYIITNRAVKFMIISDYKFLK